MDRTDAIASWLRRGALALAFAALLVRAAVPSGFMVSAPSAGGLPDLLICTGHGPLQLGKDHAPGQLPDKDRKDQPCHFAGGPAPAPPPAALGEVRPVSVAPAETLALPAWERPGLGLAAPPPPAHAPPLHV